MLKDTDLTSKDLNEIFSSLKFQRIRNLTIFQGWITDLSFVKMNNFKLKYLDLVAQKIGPYIHQLK